MDNFSLNEDKIKAEKINKLHENWVKTHQNSKITEVYSDNLDDEVKRLSSFLTKFTLVTIVSNFY